MNNLYVQKNGGTMSKKYFLLTIAFIGSSLSAADDKTITNRLRQKSRTSTPTHNSPVLSQKEYTDPLFAISAAKIDIKTNDGSDKNLEAYLHSNFHHIHGKLAALETQTENLQKKLDAQSSTHSKALEDHKQHVVQEITTHKNATQSNKPVCVVMGEGKIVTLNDAVGYLKQKSEQNEQETREVKVAHDGRLKKLESAQNAAEHKSWSRWLMDHFVASALVATGLYHVSALNGIITHTVPALLRSTVTQVLPHMYLPAGLIFAGTLAMDLHHNFQETAFNNHRSDWKKYCESQKWMLIKPTSDFFVSTAVITKAFADNIGHVIKPACKVLIGISIVQLMLGTSVAPIIPKIPSIS
jgi:hypothetical protein